MNIVITGAQGLVGSNLHLKYPTLRLDRVYDIVAGFSLPDFDVLIHLAALNSSADSISDPRLYFMTNELGTLNMLELARLHHAKFMYLTTTKDQDKNPYGTSKLCATEWIKCYRETYGLDTIINRVGNLYGPGGDNFFVNQFIRKTVNGETITIYGDGEDRRALLHIDDLARFITHQIDHWGDYNEGVVPLSGGEENTVTINQILDLIKARRIYKKPLPGQHSVLDNQTELTPTIDWRTGVTSLYDYYKRHIQPD